MNEWANALTKLVEEKIEVVPPGWKTTKQLVAEGMYREQVSKLYAAGLVERKDFSIMTARGRYPVPHYKLKK